MLRQRLSASCLRANSAVRHAPMRSFASCAACGTVQITEKVRQPPGLSAILPDFRFQVTTRITTSKIIMRAEVAANAGRSLKEAVVGKVGLPRLE